MKSKRFLALLLSLVMVLGMMPLTVFAYYDGDSLEVCTEGKTYSLFTEDNLEGQNGTTFLYVVKKGDRYYTLGNPRYTTYKEVDSVFAVDITEYYDAQTNSFSGISDNVNIGAMQYQMNSGSYMYVDGNMLLALSVPFESEGETWFEGGIRYYTPEDTYSYTRPIWHSNGDGTGYFYDSYIDWMHDSDEWVYGVLDLKYTGTDYVFALRDKSAEYTEARNADPDNYDIGVDVVAYLYAAPCGHEKNIHSEAVAPTCMDKGCEEYWYCCYCGSYFADEAFQDEIGHIPVLPAPDHSYGATGCTNCGRPTPVYTKITSYEQFLTLDPNASFIAVAEIDNGNGGKDYYVLKKEIATTMADIDEDGQPDILLVDDNSNGISDILETDENGDGVADAMEFDGVYSGEPDGVLDSEEIWGYLFYLENEYTDGYIPGLHIMGVIPVKPAADGTISVKGLDALEWIMERKYSDDELEDQYYGDGATVKDYENDFTFRIPNFWIRPVVTVDNNFYQQPYEQGDSKWWGVLFGKDGKELNSYLYEPIYGEDYPDDAVILYTESFHNLNSDGQLEHALRFLVNGEKKNFIMTSDSFWEELEGTQYPIYLYCSDAGEEYHEHIWGPWTKMNEENHKRVCTVDGCTAFDIGSHNKDENRGCTPDTEDYELGHWVSCTDCGGEYHEYHTREEAGRYYPNYWRDTGDGVHHVVYCTKCGGPVEYAEHRWSDWYRGAKQIDGEWVMGHYRDCENWPCEAQIWQAECIYDEGTVTKEPTCTENGIKEYVCTADDCACDTKYHTEEIPALGHDWGEWTPSLTDSTKEERVCKRDPSHTEERTAHEHSWSNWVDDHTTETHTRQCTLEGCTAKETEPHNWDSGVQSGAASCTEGAKTTYTCSDCGATKTETGEELGHDWGEWVYGSVDSHIRNCKRNCGVEEEFEGHEWGEWQVYDENTHRMYCDICHGYQEEDHDWNGGVETVSPTCYSTGVMTYTCGTCGHTMTEEIPMTEHTWTDWAPNGDENHKRECMDDNCGAVETLPHSWDDGVVTVEPSCTANGVKTYTCTDGCGYSYTEEIPMMPDHEWTEWSPNDDGTHTRACRCNANETKDCEWDDGVVTAPTCEREGSTVYTCTLCGNTKTETKAALDHDWSEWRDTGENAVADIHERSCKREGCDAKETGNHEWGDWKSIGSEEHKKTCSVCSGYRTSTHSWGNGTETTPATVTQSGVRTYTCSDCSATKTEVIPKIVCDHTWGKWTDDDELTHTHTCINGNGCTAYQKQAHEWNEGVVTTEPTETEEGVKTYTCTVCNHTKKEAIPMLQHTHDFGEWSSDGASTHTRRCVNGNTCTATETAEHSCDAWADNNDGTHSGKCSVCGEGMTEAHSWSDWAVGVTEDTFIRSCKCGASEEMTVQQPIEDAVVNTTKTEGNDANASLVVDNAMNLFNNVLTPEEQEAVADGNTTVSVYLEVTDVPANQVSASDKAAAEEVIGKSNNELNEKTEIGMYLDVNLFKEVTKTDENNSKTESEESKVTETSGKVTISIQIPDDLINTDDSVERIYRIIRVHEDSNGNLITDVIEGVFDPETKTFTFETDKFSTYALAYNDNTVTHVEDIKIPARSRVSFVADGRLIAIVLYRLSQTELTYLPKVPAKEGYVGTWEIYTLNGKNMIVRAMYTEK